MKHPRAFSLTELMVVVAVLAVVVAAAMPAYLRSQTRTRVTEARDNLRRAATALEAYAVDHGIHPYDGYNAAAFTSYNYWYLPREISTPIAYLPSVDIVDPFRVELVGFWQMNNIRYTSTESTWGVAFANLKLIPPSGYSAYYKDVLIEHGAWRLMSAGPDKYIGPFTGPDTWKGLSNYPSLNIPYDPTNGVVSLGDILRTQRSPVGYVNMK